MAFSGVEILRQYALPGVYMKLLVTGSRGQIDQSIKTLGQQTGIVVRCIGHPEIDLADLRGFDAIVEDEKPDVIINSAAYTQVDRAETEKDLAFAINEDGARRVAQTAAKLSIPIIQLSTDYVFSGEKPHGESYAESDETGPATIYGASKLAGEKAVKSANPDHVILRTAWVYSALGQNFLKTMLRLGAERDDLRIVNDQFGTPTHAETIANAVLKIAHRVTQSNDDDLRGVFHLTNSGTACWSDFAREIFSASKVLGGPVAKLSPIPGSEYPTPARRPANSVLNCSKIKDVYDIVSEDWRAPIPNTVAQVIKDTGL